MKSKGQTLLIDFLSWLTRPDEGLNRSLDRRFRGSIVSPLPVVTNVRFQVVAHELCGVPQRQRLRVVLGGSPCVAMPQ